MLKLEEVKETVGDEEVVINYFCKKKNVHLFEEPGCNGKITVEYMQETNYYYYKCEKTQVDCSKSDTLSN